MASRDNDEERIASIMQVAESLTGDDVPDGYTFIGSATSGAFRFKWTAREIKDGRFVVDETVGGGSVAVTSPPMSRDAVLPYIDDRRQRIQRKIDDVKRELAILVPRPANPAPLPASPPTAPPTGDGERGVHEDEAAEPVRPVIAAPVRWPPPPVRPDSIPSPKGERDPEDIFDEIRRMLQETK